MTVYRDVLKPWFEYFPIWYKVFVLWANVCVTGPMMTKPYMQIVYCVLYTCAIVNNSTSVMYSVKGVCMYVCMYICTLAPVNACTCIIVLKPKDLYTWCKYYSWKYWQGLKFGCGVQNRYCNCIGGFKFDSLVRNRHSPPNFPAIRSVPLFLFIVLGSILVVNFLCLVIGCFYYIIWIFPPSS